MAKGRNLVRNGGFERSKTGEKVPASWRTWAPRNVLAPAIALDRDVHRGGKASLRMGSRNRAYTLGGVRQELADLHSGRCYELTAYVRTREVKWVQESVALKLEWLRKDGGALQKHFFAPEAPARGWRRVGGLVEAPQGAERAVVELRFRWAKGGAVWWDDVSLREAPLKRHRLVTLGSVAYVPPAGSTVEQNLHDYCDRAKLAGRLGCDLVCLTEGVNGLRTGLSYVKAAEPIPGPFTEALGAVARRYGMYLVVGLYERAGRLCYNTAVLIDRDGQLLGRYRKTHLPEAEALGGLTPGDEHPVFQTDFGRVGIEICYDNFFPEVTRALAVNGAEVICLPIAGDGRAGHYNWDIVARARAIDNSVFFVSSIWGPRSLIIDPEGHILADSAGQDTVITARVDLDQRRFSRWLSARSAGCWNELWPVERRPRTYGDLARDLGPPPS